MRSKTFNAASTGTFGQALDAVVEADGIDFGDSAVVGQLQENPGFRSNIGILNMGSIDAETRIELFDRGGASLGSFELEVPAGEAVQDGQPYDERFGRSDIVGGYARVTVLRGTDIYVYGSVIDNETGDPTTVTMDRGTVQPLSDISKRAAEIALAQLSAPESSELWVLENLEAGSTIRENAYADRAEAIDIPDSGGPWHLVVIDPEPTQMYGHPMQWLLIDGGSEQVQETLTVGYPPLIEPSSRPTESSFSEVGRGALDGRSVRSLDGDGGPTDADHSHKEVFQEKAVQLDSGSRRSPLSIGLVMDAGGAGEEAREVRPSSTSLDRPLWRQGRPVPFTPQDVARSPDFPTSRFRWKVSSTAIPIRSPVATPSVSREACPAARRLPISSMRPRVAERQRPS